jgi:hypothetical protein
VGHGHGHAHGDDGGHAEHGESLAARGIGREREWLASGLVTTPGRTMGKACDVMETRRCSRLSLTSVVMCDRRRERNCVLTSASRRSSCTCDRSLSSCNVMETRRCTKAVAHSCLWLCDMQT